MRSTYNNQWRTVGLALWIALSLLIGWAAGPGITQANGGALIYTQDTGPFNVQLALSPTPPVPTLPAHFTMILTRRSSEVRVTDATVLVEPTMNAMAMPGIASQRFVQNQARPDQYDVDVPVSMEGIWDFKINIISPTVGQTSFVANAKVEKPDAPWPIIIAILVALPALAGLTWYFLFRKQDDDEDDEGGETGKGKPEVKVGT